MRSVLGVDVASTSWVANGSARIEIDDQSFRHVTPAAIRWPTDEYSPGALANAINEHARKHRVVAVSLDGPQGWRDPSTPVGTPGVGRRCEHMCRTQGKAGQFGVTYPGNQRAWFEFCIALFDELLRKPNVVLKNDGAPLPREGYVVLECFPTSVWRASGLSPLPGKSKHPALAPYVTALADAYMLPPFSVTSHDDLQGVVAAITAAAVAGGVADPLPGGVSAFECVHDDGVTRRVEGIIWDARPRGPANIVVHPRRRPVVPDGAPSANVTQRVLDQVNRMRQPGSMMIALRGLPSGTRKRRLTIAFQIDGDEYSIVVGDSHGAWRSHQNDQTRASFESLFARLAELPNERVPLSGLRTSLAVTGGFGGSI